MSNPALWTAIAAAVVAVGGVVRALVALRAHKNDPTAHLK